MVLFFSFFSKLFQSWYHLLPSHAISYRTSYTSVLFYLIFLFDRGIYFLLKTLGITFNHIFQLNCGKFFLGHVFSQGIILLLFLFFWLFLKSESMYLSVYYSSLHVEVLPWSPVCGRLKFAGILIVSGGGLHVWVLIAIMAIMSHQSSKQALQNFPQWRFLFYPLHQKPGSCKSGLWCSLKKLDSFEIDFQEFLGMAIAAFTLGLLPPHYRDKTPLSTWPKRALLMFLVWLVGTGTMLTL